MTRLERGGVVLAALSLSAVALFAFWPQHLEDPRTGWCEQYPVACAYEDPAAWARFVEDRHNGLR